MPAADEDLSFLAGDWRIFQLKRGHRWSLDDLVTAAYAIREARRGPPPARAIDIGCGIGSVLLMVAWALPATRLLGVEAQPRSVALARRSLAYDGADDRCEVRLGDMRDPAIVPEGAVFELVTGTPPYLPLGTGLVSGKAQRGPCCFEIRGGIEEYCLAAQRLLAPTGCFVVCAGAQDPIERGWSAALAAGLRVARSVDVVPRDGKSTLLYVHVMRGADAETEADAEPLRERFVVRQRDGSYGPDMAWARTLLGMPPARS